MNESVKRKLAAFKRVVEVLAELPQHEQRAVLEAAFQTLVGPRSLEEKGEWEGC